jgi:phosphoribosylanthranilate isomerase
VPVIKVCGVTRPEDALHAAQSGASLVGLILWPGSKRSVTDAGLAREIAAAAREGGAEPVAVFVDENAEQARPPHRPAQRSERKAADVCTTGRVFSCAHS